MGKREITADSISGDTIKAGRKVLTRFNPITPGMGYGRQLFASFMEWTAASPENESLGPYVKEAAVVFGDLSGDEQRETLTTFGYLLAKMLDDCKEPVVRYGILGGAVAFSVSLGHASETHPTNC